RLREQLERNTAAEAQLIGHAPSMPNLRRRNARHDEPGHTRETHNIVKRLAIEMDPIQQSRGATAVASNRPPYDAAMDEFESRILRAALLEAGGRKTEAARLLGIPRKRLYLRLRHHNLLDGPNPGQK